MVDAEVVLARLAVLRDHLRRLQEVGAGGLEAFLADTDLQLRAERSLQLALQAMLDIGTHLIASEGLERPATYEEVVPVLGAAGILGPELVETLRGAAGLRNLLVHDYLRLDHTRLFEAIRQRIQDLRAFGAAIAALLENEPGAGS